MPRGDRLICDVTAADAASSAIVSSAEPAPADTRQMQRFTGAMAAQNGAVLINTFHRRVLGRQSNVRTANG